MTAANRQIRLHSRPSGAPTAANFDLVTSPVPPVPDGSVLRRTIYLSLDPYMRGRMSDAKSYAAPVSVGDVMCGHTVSQVVESRNPQFKAGDFVTGYDGWQEYAVSNGADLRTLDPRDAPISTALSVLGMPGLTAWVGLVDIGRPKAGETVVVSAASGAVGSIVGQLARVRGCRAVGIAGSDDKCRYVTESLGFDACVNYKAADFVTRLQKACPDGIDIDFENVGGAVYAAVLRLLNRGARIPLCGAISEYSATTPTIGPGLLPLLVSRATLQGFIVSDHFDRTSAAMQEMAPLVRSGRLKYREDVTEGLDQAPNAFIGLLEGRNFGKAIVRVSPDPTR